MDIGSAEWNRLIIDGAAALGVALQADHVRLFARHAAALLEWNAVTNLTAITAPERVALHHFLDSLAAVRLIGPGSEVLDVGSGGGFPGLPLHIVIDRLQTTLIDASRKKVSFLRHVLRELALSGIQAQHLRVEEMVRKTAGLKCYDVITSRAFSAVEPLVHAVWPLLRPEGRLIAFKGDIDTTEMNALQAALAGEELGEPITLKRLGYALPGLKNERSLLIVSRGK